MGGHPFGFPGPVEMATMQPMRDVLQHLAEYNGMPFGEVHEILGRLYCWDKPRSINGACFDWAHQSLATPYSFLFEIYNKRKQQQIKINKATAEDRHKFGQEMSHVAEAKTRPHWSSPRGLRSEAFPMELTVRNPTNETEFRTTLLSWTQTYVRMAERIAQHRE